MHLNGRRAHSGPLPPVNSMGFQSHVT